MMKCFKKWWQKLAVIIAFSVIIGYLAEFAYEGIARYKIISQGQDTIIEGIEWDQIEAEGAVSENGVLHMVQDGNITIEFQEKYIDKLIYQYTSDTDFDAPVEVEIKDVYGNYVTKSIEDYSSSKLSASFVNIRGVVNKIVINVSAGVTINNISIDNHISLNKYRILYISIIICLLLCLCAFRVRLSCKPEIIFLIISMTIGGLLIVLSPPRFMSWDEHIHFYNSFIEPFENQEVNWSESEYYLYYHPETLGGMPFLSKEEKAMQIQYLNSVDDNIVMQTEKVPFRISLIGYCHIVLAVKICQMLGISFYNTVLIGKFANLLLYCLVITYAIKCIPYLKRTLMTLCLMPTPILLASSYSYDSLLISLFVLGTALLLREFYYPEKQMKIKD